MALSSIASVGPSQEFQQALAFLKRGGRTATEAIATFDLPVARNVLDWVTNPAFLDFPQVWDHWGQYQLLRDLCQLRCPVCNPFDKDSEGPGRCWGKSRVELEAEVLLARKGRGLEEVCPKCGGGRDEFEQDGLLYDYNTLLACTGMRSGKSSTIGLFATYLEHVFYTFAGFERSALAKTLGQAPGTTFDVAFVATTSKQTEQTIWDYFTGFRERSPWLQRYVKRLKELERAQPKIGLKRWEYSELDRSINNELVGISFQSLHSNSASMAGATRIAAFVDELARFDTTESKRGADEVWRVLSASLKTVRRAAVTKSLPRHLFGIKAATSSPISMDDKMMTMLSKADLLDNALALKLATWEFNPQHPRESFSEEYAEDPIQAERDFGANPPLTETPLIEDVPRFAKAIEKALTPATLFRSTFPEDALGRQYIGLEVEDSIISSETPRFITFDAGSSFDSFAGACAHPVWVDIMPDPADPNGSVRRILLTIYDWVIRMLPTERPKRTVWFDSVVKIIEVLKDKFRIAQVCFDRWQSESLIQGIRALGIQAEQESIVAKDFISFKSDCYAGKVRLLPPVGKELEFDESGQLKLYRTPIEMSAQAVGIYELVKLSRSEDLKRIMNPNKGKRRGYDSDDVAQVIVGAHRQIQVALADDPSERSMKARLRRETMGGEQWAGGGIARTMSGWSVAPPGRQTGAGRTAKGGLPGYTSGDSWVGPEGQTSKPHVFAERGSVRVRRW